MKQIIQKSKYALVIFVAIYGLIFLAPGAAAAPGDSLFKGAKSEACAGVQLSAGSGPDCSGDDQTSLSTTISKGINLISTVVGIIAVIMIIIGGIRFIVANGDSAKVTSARNTIIYALVGLLLVAFAQIIVKFVLSRV